MQKFKKMLKSTMFVAGFTAFSLFISSCSIDDSTNNSPNAINEVSVKSKDGVYGMLVSLQVGAGDFYSGDRSRILSIWNWQMCAPPGIGRPQPVSWNSYNLASDGPTKDNWSVSYKSIKIANDIIAFTPSVDNFSTKNAETQNTILGIAKAYKALLFGELASMYGSIPIEIVGLEPAQFVDQDQAYTKVQSLLDEAIVHFGKGGVAVSRDLNYAGDKDKWIKACNSLKARYYLHAEKYTEALASAKLGMNLGDASLFAKYSDNAGEYSPWGHWANDEGGVLRPLKEYLDAIKSNNSDTRLAEYFTPVEGVFHGFDLERTAASTDTMETIFAYTASMKKYSAYSESFPLISANEVALIIAECKAIANDASAVDDLNAVRKQFGLADFSGSGDALSTAIMQEKDKALYLEGQTYYDQRRLGKLNDVGTNKVPRRWVYPEIEFNANPNCPGDNDLLILHKK
jgi:hypothetical protein